MNIMIMNIIKFNHDDGNYVVSFKKNVTLVHAMQVVPARKVHVNNLAKGAVPAPFAVKRTLGKGNPNRACP